MKNGGNHLPGVKQLPEGGINNNWPSQANRYYFIPFYHQTKGGGGVKTVTGGRGGGGGW